MWKIKVFVCFALLFFITVLVKFFAGEKVFVGEKKKRKRGGKKVLAVAVVVAA